MIESKCFTRGLIAVQCWLASRHASFGFLVIDRHYSSPPGEIAYVVILGS